MTDDPTLRFHDDAATKPALETVLERINDFRSSIEASIADLRSSTEASINDLRTYTETSIKELRVYTETSVNEVRGSIADLRKSMEDRFEAMETRVDRVEGVTLTFRSELRELRRDIKNRGLLPDNP